MMESLQRRPLLIMPHRGKVFSFYPKYTVYNFIHIKSHAHINVCWGNNELTLYMFTLPIMYWLVIVIVGSKMKKKTTSFTESERSVSLLIHQVYFKKYTLHMIQYYSSDLPTLIGEEGHQSLGTMFHFVCFFGCSPLFFVFCFLPSYLEKAAQKRWKTWGNAKGQH